MHTVLPAVAVQVMAMVEASFLHGQIMPQPGFAATLYKVAMAGQNPVPVPFSEHPVQDLIIAACSSSAKQAQGPVCIHICMGTTAPANFESAYSRQWYSRYQHCSSCP